MPAKYKLVLRKDMRKDAAEGSKLYYASANTTGTCDVYELCDLISAQSTASSGDVKLILDELVNVMRRNLGKGEVVKVGELGSFQLRTRSITFNFHLSTFTSSGFSEMSHNVILLSGGEVFLARMPARFFQLTDQLVADAYPFQQLHGRALLRDIREVHQGQFAPSPYFVLIQ